MAKVFPAILSFFPAIVLSVHVTPALAREECRFLKPIKKICSKLESNTGLESGQLYLIGRQSNQWQAHPIDRRSKAPRENCTTYFYVGAANGDRGGPTVLNVKTLHRVKNYKKQNVRTFPIEQHTVHLARNIWRKLPRLTRQEIEQSCGRFRLDTYELFHSVDAPQRRTCLYTFFHKSDFSWTRKKGANNFDTFTVFDRRTKFRFGFDLDRTIFSRLVRLLTIGPALASNVELLPPEKYVRLTSQIISYSQKEDRGVCIPVQFQRAYVVTGHRSDEMELRITNFYPNTTASNTKTWIFEW